MSYSNRSGESRDEWAEIEQRLAQMLLLEPDQEPETIPVCADRSWDWLWNVTEDTIFFSERVRDLLGCSKNELRNSFRAWVERVHPDDGPVVNERTAAYFKGEIHRLELTFRLRKADGSYLRVATRAHAVKRSGRTEQLFGHYTVVDDGKSLQDAHDLAEMVRSVPCGVSMLDLSGRFEFVNEAFAESLGFTAEELLGKAWNDTIHPDDLEAVNRAHETMLETGRAAVECRVLSRNGSPLKVDLMIAKRKGADNASNGYFCFCKAHEQGGWAIAS